MKRWPYWVGAFWLEVLICSLLLDLEPDDIDLPKVLDAPGTYHVFGTADLGRDIGSRPAAGEGVSMLVELLVMAVTLSVGTVVELLAGYCGCCVVRALMQVTDVFLASPGILLEIAFAAVFWPGLDNLLLAFCMTSWVGYARLTRPQTLSLRQHLQAASASRIMREHMLPLLSVPLLLVVNALGDQLRDDWNARCARD